MNYPQVERCVWADAYADKCSAIWRLCDARTALLNAPHHRRQAAQEAVCKLETECALAVARSLAVRRDLDEAENHHNCPAGSPRGAGPLEAPDVLALGNGESR